MAQHGYLREYDDDDRYFGDDDDRERGWRDERGWRGDRERDRNFMFDERSGGRYRSDDDDDRRGGGFFSRTGDEARSWFRDDEGEGSRGQSRGRRFERGGSDAGEWFGGRSSSSAWEGNRDWPQRDRGSSGFGGGRQQGSFSGREDRRQFSSHPDDHYRSWRDKQMQALDRDYEDYCREREMKFHEDFDTWRSNRSNRELLLQQDHGLRGKWGAEQGSGPDEQTFTPETTAVGNTMTTSETHEPQSTTEKESTNPIGTRGKR